MANVNTTTGIIHVYCFALLCFASYEILVVLNVCVFYGFNLFLAIL